MVNALAGNEVAVIVNFAFASAASATVALTELTEILSSGASSSHIVASA